MSGTDYDAVVTMVLLGERGISPGYIARCVNRTHGTRYTADDVKRLARRRVAPGGRRARAS